MVEIFTSRNFEKEEKIKTKGRVIRKKCWPEMFNSVKNGKKKFDLRLADEKYNVGDVLVLEEFNPRTKKYTGRKLKKKITYVLKTNLLPFWTDEEIHDFGFVVMSLK